MASEDKDLEFSEHDEPRLYELGYHLLPTIAEESVAEEVVKIKDGIGNRAGLIATEQLPRQITLAYSVSKVISDKRAYFDTALFGWIRFRMSPKELIAFKQELRENKSILRFLVFQATEAAVPTKKMTFLKERAASKRTSEEKKPDVRLSDEEIDKTIEELVVE